MHINCFCFNFHKNILFCYLYGTKTLFGTHYTGISGVYINQSLKDDFIFSG